MDRIDIRGGHMNQFDLIQVTKWTGLILIQVTTWTGLS